MRIALAIVIASVHPAVENEWLTKAQLRLYRQGTRYNALILALGAIFVSLACGAWIPWQTRTTWCIAVSILCVTFDLLGRRVDAVRGDELQLTRWRARTCALTATVFTLAWASMSIFLWAPADEINHMVIVLILACSIAGSNAIGAVHPATAAVTYLIYAVFLVGRLMVADSWLDHTLASLSATYMGVMAGQLVAIATTSRKMLVLEHERSQLVEDLQHAKADSDRERARAVSAGRVKSQFLSNMSHELRTPMNAILGFSELIKHKSLGDAVDKYAEYAEIIHTSGRQLLSLIDDMLDLARIEGGRLSLRETSVDLEEVIAQAIDTRSHDAARMRLSLDGKIAREFPRVRADERAMRQIMAHLLSNALKFTPAGGRVTIFARIESDGRPGFGVEDTGIGVAVEDQSTAFQRFGQGRHDVTSVDRGTGLGLAMVKGFAEAHDGEVKLESKLGSGTRVTVLLPVSRIENAAALRRKAG